MESSGQTNPARPSAGSKGASSRAQRAKAVAAAGLGALLVLFAVLNSQTVTIHWVVATSHAPLIVAVAACGLLGFAVGWLAARRHAARRSGR